MCESTEMIVKKANGHNELEAIFRLRYKAYLRKGYIAENHTGTMSDEWDGLPATTYFVAIENKRIIGAVRLVMESAKGLPMERVFENEVSLLRKQGRKLAEASTLVTAGGHSESDRQVWLRLCKAVWQQAEARHIDDLCIAVTRSHLGFYRRLLFERIGPSARYESLNNITAYPLRLRVGEARVRHRSHRNNNAQSLRSSLLE